MTPEQEAQAGQNPGTPIYDPASQQPQPQAATGRDWEANPYTDADWESYNDPNRGGSTMEMTPEKERASAAQHKYAVAQGYETEGPHGGYYATDKFKQYQAGRQNPQQAAPQQPAYKSPMLGKRG
jgi:hypothetical protein